MDNSFSNNDQFQNNHSSNGTPQINDRGLTPANPQTQWQQPAAHVPPTQQPEQPAVKTAGHAYNFSNLNLQSPSLPTRPAVSLSQEKVHILNQHAAALIAEERRILDEAERTIATPGFLKAFDIYLKASQK